MTSELKTGGNTDMDRWDEADRDRSIARTEGTAPPRRGTVP